jgi:hypothetical protein
MAASPEKKQKTEEDAKEDEKKEDEKKDDMKVEEEPEAKAPAKELEEDAKKDTSPKIKDTVAFLVPDTTINVLPSSAGSMLMALSDGGLQHLLAGARANIGVKSGRYMFEARVIEQIHLIQDGGYKSNPFSKHCIRIGFAAGRELFAGEVQDSVAFDNEGFLICNKNKEKVSSGFGRDSIFAVVLNLDQKSPNHNTISLFIDGKRACEPKALPEALQGKTLFPIVTFKNATVHVNFSQPCVALPFTCKVLQEAAAKEVSITKYDAPADGKYKVLFPVGLPDEGTFDWLDMFLKQNLEYTEISDRMIVEWVTRSMVKDQGNSIFQ